MSAPDEAVAAVHAAYVAMLEAYADWRDVSQNGHEARAAFTRAALTYCHKVTRVTERVNV